MWFSLRGHVPSATSLPNNEKAALQMNCRKPQFVVPGSKQARGLGNSASLRRLGSPPLPSLSSTSCCSTDECISFTFDSAGSLSLEEPSAGILRMDAYEHEEGECSEGGFRAVRLLSVPPALRLPTAAVSDEDPAAPPVTRFNSHYSNLSFELFDMYDCDATGTLGMHADDEPRAGFASNRLSRQGSGGRDSLLQRCMNAVRGPDRNDNDYTEWDLLVSCSADLGLGAADRMHSLRLDEEASISRPQPVQVEPQVLPSKRKRPEPTGRPLCSPPIPIPLPAKPPVKPMSAPVLPIGLRDVHALDLEIMRSAGALRPRQLVSMGQRCNQRAVEYTCSLCEETYQRLTEDNAWWSVARAQCPHCLCVQYPFVDIEAPLNAMELDPNAAVVYCEEGTPLGAEAIGAILRGDSACHTPACDPSAGNPSMTPNPACRVRPALNSAADSREPSISVATDKCFDSSPARTLRSRDAAQLLVLMKHARQCQGRHSDPSAQEACTSVKLLMLHVRDCSGQDPVDSKAPCSRAWCRPVKHMMHHLLHCTQKTSCQVCNPRALPAVYRDLRDRQAAEAAAEAAAGPSEADTGPATAT